MKKFLVAAALFLGVAAFAQNTPPAGAVLLSKKAAVGVSVDGVETVVTNYQLKGKTWKEWLVVPMIKAAAFDFPSSEMVDSVSVVRVGGAQWIHFAYLNKYSQTSEVDLVHVVYNPLTSDNVNCVFTGVLIPGDGLIVEGWSDLEISEENMAASDLDMAPVMALKEFVSSDTRLREVPKAKLLDQNILEWWHSSNPNAVSGKATSVAIGAVDPESGIASEFADAGHQSSKKYVAAVFNHMGETLLVAKSLSGGDCALAWAEPACMNKNDKRYLYNWYFENDTTVALVFVQNKKLVKYHISLASHSLKITN